MVNKAKSPYIKLLQESQTILALSYVAAIGIGMLFSYRKYDVFGINIFDYADVFDFLIAPFADYKILLFTLISLLLTYIIFKSDRAYQHYFPKSYNEMNFGLSSQKWYLPLRNISLAILFLLYLFMAAKKYGELTKQDILNNENVTVEFAGDEKKTGKMIGKTKEIVFLVHEGGAEAIPLSLVQSIVLHLKP